MSNVYQPRGNGIGNVASFQVSSIPYLSASLAVPILGSAPIVVNFPLITKFVTVRNDLDPSAAAVVLRFGFSAIGVSGTANQNYGLLRNGESYTGDWKVKSIYLLSNSTTPTSGSVLAGLTSVEINTDFDNYSGTLNFAPPTGISDPPIGGI